MSKIPFNVDAYTARLIGRENVSKLSGAVLELVKNAYDADATVCILYYESGTDSLYLADNGTGMNQDIIRNSWMTIGRSGKRDRLLSGGGRVQTGAKGIGRFALDRIAGNCTMLTKTNESSLLWSVNWDEFSDKTNITDVTADLNSTTTSFKDFMQGIRNESVKKSIEQNFQTGTIFKLEKLHDEWKGVTLTKIAESLQTLMPYEMSSVFSIFLYTEGTPTPEAEIRHDNEALSFDYKITFSVSQPDEPSKDAVQIVINRDEFDFGDDFQEIMEEAGFSDEDREFFTGKPIVINSSFGSLISGNNKPLANTVGSFSGVLFFNKITSSKDDKKKYFYKNEPISKNKRGVFAGVKLYRDYFRIRPYGEPNTSGYDWLLLANRKNMSPAAPSHKGSWRVGVDQIMGYIHTSRVDTELFDQSNREGIVETKEFQLLKEFIIGVIRLFEKDRQYVFRKLADYSKRKNEYEQIVEEINSRAAASSYSTGKTNSDETVDQKETRYIEATKAKIVLDAKDEEIKNLEDENKLLRALATTGIVTNTYIHEFKDLSHKLSLKIVMAKEALELDNDPETAGRYINEANRIRESFDSWFKVTIETVRRDKRSYKQINLNDLMEQIANSWREVLSRKSISVTFIRADENLFVRGFPYEFDTIISNLIANSVASFDNNPTTKMNIAIRISYTVESIFIDYSDTGVGLSTNYKNNPEVILESLETDRRNESNEITGTGMGMWIIQRTLSEYGGSIDLSKNKTSKIGFSVTLSLPRK